MPLVRISIRAGKAESDRNQVSNQIYDVMRATLQIPEGDRFHVITEHAAEHSSLIRTSCE